MMQDPGTDSVLSDSFYREELTLIRFAYSNQTPIRTVSLDSPLALSDAQLPEPDLSSAVEQAVERRHHVGSTAHC